MNSLREKQSLRIFTFLLLLAVGVFSMKTTVAQDVSVGARLSSTAVSIGDTVGLMLESRQAANDMVLFPELKAGTELSENLEVVAIQPYDTLHTDNQIIIRQKLTIQPFDLDTFYIPAFDFLHQLPADSIDTLQTPQLMLISGLMPADTNIDTTRLEAVGIATVKANKETPLTWEEFWQRFYPYILGSLLLIIIGAAAVYYIIEHRKPKDEQEKVPDEPPHQMALKALRILEQQKLWQNNLVKRYYSRLTNIIRTYIYQRFGIFTLERTSEEVLQAVKSSGIVAQSEVEKLTQMLTVADLVKFAKHKPLPDENELSLKNAFEFVSATAPKPTENQISDNDTDNKQNNSITKTKEQNGLNT